MGLECLLGVRRNTCRNTLSGLVTRFQGTPQQHVDGVGPLAAL